MHHQLIPPDRRLAIFGAGGHGREIAWLAREIWGDDVALTFLVDIPSPAPLVDDIPVRPVTAYAEDHAGGAYIVAIGDPLAREKCVHTCESAGLRPWTLIHPRVECSSRVNVGAGSVVCAGSVLTTNIKLGRHVHINVGCTVSHDAVIGDYATLSPGVHVPGHVHLGRRVFIGTGANLINGSSVQPLVIADDAVVAAGACVTKAVAAGSMVAGVPAVRKR